MDKSKGLNPREGSGKGQEWRSLSQQDANIIWMIIQDVVSDLTDSKKRIYKKDVYDAKYADKTKSRKPKATMIKNTIMESKESSLRNIRGAIAKLLKAGFKNRQVAYEIYTNQNNLVRDMMFRDGAVGRIFTERLFRAYEGDDLLEEAKIEKKEQKRKTQDEKQYRGALGRLGTQMRNIYKQDEKERNEKERNEKERDDAFKKIIADQKRNEKERDDAFKKIITEQKRKKQDEKRYRGALGRLGTQMSTIYKQDLQQRIDEQNDLKNVLSNLPGISEIGPPLPQYILPTTNISLELKDGVPLLDITQQTRTTGIENLNVNDVKEILQTLEVREGSSSDDDDIPTYDINGIVLTEREWTGLATALMTYISVGTSTPLGRLNRQRWISFTSNIIAETKNIETEQDVIEAVSTYVANFYPDRQRAEFTIRTAALRQTQTNDGEVLGAIQNIDKKISNADIKRTLAEEKAERSRQQIANQAEEERRQIAEEQKIQIENLGLMVDNLSRQFPELKSTARQISTDLKNNMTTKRNYKILNDSQISNIIDSIPVRYRDVFGDSIRNLLRGDVNMNIMLSGLAGLSTLMLSNSSLAAQSITIATNYLLDTFDINLNRYLYDNAIDQKAEQSTDIKNLSTNVDSGSDADGEYVEIAAADLTENAINQLDMKVTEEQARQIRINAREYIKMQLNNLRIALTQQITTPSGRTTQPLNISNLDLDDIPAEIVQPLGFFDYIRNVGGLPQAIMRNIPDINLNDLKQAMPTLTEIKSGIPGVPFMRGKQPDLIDVLGPDGKPVPDKGILVDMKDRLENIDRKNFPSRDEIKEGAYNAVAGAVIPAAVRGGAMGAVGGIARGGVGGAAVGAVTGPMIRRYYEQQGADMSDPEVLRYIKKLQALPPMIAGALIGASGIGENLFSGAGVTERKLTVDPSVLAETMATEQQDTKQTKKWITKAIFPTPDILDETRQEKFVDDLEFAAFNYIEPTSQGATGTVRTNPLKRSQFLSDQIRYMDAGISMPSMLYNKEFPTNTPQKQMDTYKLGQDMLPVMEFMEQDNADTFNDTKFHFVNNQDTAVEMLSVFSNYSDVRNYWQINERSKLYNLYA